MQRRFLDYLIISFKGLAMGAADVVPGVSGGTIAFISGIYEELLESIDGVNLKFIKIWKTEGFKSAWLSINGNFLLALFLGIAISIVSLAKVIKWLLINEAILLWSFFFGLVLASVLFIGKQIKSWNIWVIITIVITTILSYLITISDPFASPDSNLYLLFCGFIGIIAMILPGVSGAFILLILGSYQTAINTVDDLFQSVITLNFELFKAAFVKFLMLALGAIVGIKTFSKLLNWMFKNHKNLTLAMLTGFMIGSLNKIWPWKETLSTRINSKGLEVPFQEQSILPFSLNGDHQLIKAIAFMTVGFLTIFLLERFSSKIKTLS
jgi:putative membrane protein